MYRVELKALFFNFLDESFVRKVPNVPCGVERPPPSLQGKVHQAFLMYRVELKAAPFSQYWQPVGEVPNVPCGVESSQLVCSNSIC